MQNAELWERLETAAASITKRDDRQPQVALVLGSGLGGYADTLESATVIPYDQIPGFPVSTVHGHSGNLVLGEIEGLQVVAMQGRTHLYEGYSAQEVTFPLRVLWKLGAGTLLITNACGGINRAFRPGDLVVISDHINLTGQSPLTGENDDRLGTRFPDMSNAYDPELRALAHAVGNGQGLGLQRGIYAGLLGPTYETPAEVRMVERLGADLLGMSTVCEVIAARHLGMRVLGISCVTNLAAGMAAEILDHTHIEETAGAVRDQFQNLIDGVLRRLARGEAAR